MKLGNKSTENIYDEISIGSKRLKRMDKNWTLSSHRITFLLDGNNKTIYEEDKINEVINKCYKILHNRSTEEPFLRLNIDKTNSKIDEPIS